MIEIASTATKSDDEYRRLLERREVREMQDWERRCFIIVPPSVTEPKHLQIPRSIRFH